MQQYAELQTDKIEMPLLSVGPCHTTITKASKKKYNILRKLHFQILQHLENSRVQTHEPHFSVRYITRRYCHMHLHLVDLYYYIILHLYFSIA